MTFAGTPAAVSRTFAVSPLQMRFRTPRRAHARRSFVARQSAAGRVRGVPSHIRLPGPRRADACRSCLQARTCAGEMATFATHKRMYNQDRGTSAPRGCPSRTRGGDRQHNVGSLPGRHHAMDCGLWATCSPNLSTTCQTIPRIAGCRGSDCLAGFLHSRRDRAIDCGGHTGGYNGHQREQCADCLGKCRLGGKHRSENRL
jgi:hypothetical protein